MHDRQVDGKTYTFGNHGALWMNAMTWWDHETESIWSQPWGRALEGELRGTQLKLLPFSLVPWETWHANHPDTLVLTTGGSDSYRGAPAIDDFVVGVAIGEASRGYYYDALAQEIILNDELKGIPLVLHVNPETRDIHIFVRQLGDGRTLTFDGDGEQMVDNQTGSLWNPARGLATEGVLAGQGLREVPYISSYDWAWRDIYPNSDFYGE